MNHERDAFISYASEERESVAKPLAELVTTLGVSVWFDKFDLKMGDSLRRKIDEGLTSANTESFSYRNHFFATEGDTYENISFWRIL